MPRVSSWAILLLAAQCYNHHHHYYVLGGDFDPTFLQAEEQGGQQQDRRQQQQGRQQDASSGSFFFSSGDGLMSILADVKDYGQVVGRRQGGIDFFRGIPYAAPPVGDLRFAPPEPPRPWAPARLDASRFGPDCWQVKDPVANPNADPTKMSEDCLYLNIFAPASRSSSQKLPVMVWLHGGAFQQGGARRPEYDGRRLAERNLVVVTLNYRLGALGFMVSSSDGLYGNFGLMDQRAALDWIHKHVAAFGGDPNNITLFGESAGAVMIGLHLMMEGAGTTLFHKAILQSNPLGYTFRSVVVGDFLGEALKRAVDCRDLACLRNERVEELMVAQASLMGVPRSVGDFFAWGPILTQETILSIGPLGSGSSGTGIGSIGHTGERLPRRLLHDNHPNWQSSNERRKQARAHGSWNAVNVSQPLKGLDKILPNIPILMGSNRHEGEIFVYSVFPAPMPKPVYWMFVGALFRDSSARVMQHYRAYVEEIEEQAEKTSKKQVEEELNRLFYMEHKEELEEGYKHLLSTNATDSSLELLVDQWSRGGALLDSDDEDDMTGADTARKNWRYRFWNSMRQGVDNAMDAAFFHNHDDVNPSLTPEEQQVMKARLRAERRAARHRKRALKEAAKVVVDLRPVMSRIIDDYLFRCPTWNYAHQLSRLRERLGGDGEDVYVYRFSQPTHIAGYKACWGKSCHTAELPYAFQAMDVIRESYSTLGEAAEKEAPSAPEYPYTDIMAAFRGALGDDDSLPKKQQDQPRGRGNSSKFQNILNHFFGDYFLQDSDEDLASDMADRWASFAKYGNPNHDDDTKNNHKKIEWIPWRGSRKLKKKSGNNTDNSCDESEFINFDDIGGKLSLGSGDNFYRDRALAALQMTTVEKDMYRTELKRRSSNDEYGSMKSFMGGLLRDESQGVPRFSQEAAKEAIEFARQIGVVGRGLKGDPRMHHHSQHSPDFFPELLELKWPPEGRLVERDCTCDFWDRTRYRY